MDRDELIEFLKANLSISLRAGRMGYGMDSGPTIEVTLRLGDEKISEDYMEVPERD